MNGIIWFALGFSAGALSFAALALLASLPRLEDYADEALGAEAIIGNSCHDLSSRGPTGASVHSGRAFFTRQPIAWIGAVPCYSAEDIRQALND